MDSLLESGIAVFRSGNRAASRKIFKSYVEKYPQSERGWKWMYRVSRTDEEAIYCLRRVLQINPGNQKARELLNKTLADAHRKRQNLRTLHPGAIGAFLGVVLCGMFVTVSTWLYAGYAGSNCLLPGLYGSQFCPSAPVGTPAIGDPAAMVPVGESRAQSAFSDPQETEPDLSVTPTPSAIFVPEVTFTSSVTPAPSSTSTQVVTSTSIPVRTIPPELRPLASPWRKWPIVPELSAHAREILRAAVQNPDLDPHTFSKVGDCQMVAGIFLAGYVNGTYSIPAGMEETVEWFADSMMTDTLTAENGYGINTVLDPNFALPAGYDQCLHNETPLDCELRTRRPVIVLIGMGTNWIPNAEVSFERYLRRIVDRVLETGALPILATKADNVEADWKLNEVIARVAYEYDLPLVNVWLSVQDLPNHGLEKPPRQVYLTGDGWMRRNKAWLYTLDEVRRVIVE